MEESCQQAHTNTAAKRRHDGDGDDDGDDDRKHTFIVELAIVTGIEGLILVKGIQVCTDGGDACAWPFRSLSRRWNTGSSVRRTAP